MKPEQKDGCDYCISQYVSTIDRKIIPYDGLVRVREAVEVFGKAFACDETKVVCLPLLRVQSEIDKCRGKGGH